MGSFSDTPELIAGGTVRPFRFIAASTVADDTGLEVSVATADEVIVGVSDGSTNGPTSGNHAVAGEPINLQGGDVVLVQCGTTNLPTRGELVQANNDGTARAANTGAGPRRRYQGYVALQNGVSGGIIRIQKVGGFIYYPTTL